MLFFSNIFAQENTREPFIIKSLGVSTLNIKQKTIQIRMVTEALGNGSSIVQLNVPSNMKHVLTTYQSDKMKIDKSANTDHNWIVNVAEDGYYTIEASISFDKDNNDAGSKNLVDYQAIPIHFEIRNGQVVDYGISPDQIFNVLPKNIQPEFHSQLNINRKNISGNTRQGLKLDKKDNTTESAVTYVITVDIHGRLFYDQSASIQKGVPGIRLRLDWDWDNNPTTGYTPYADLNIPNEDYSDTDMNGNYHFYLLFESSRPATDIAPHIRVYGLNNNGATFDGDRGNGASLTPISGTDTVRITNSTIVSGQVNPKITGVHGSALRHLYRSEQFSINKLGFAPHQIRYYIRTGASTSYFCGSGSCGNGINVNVPYILFNQVQRSHLGHHEYGHFIEYDKVGFTVGTGVSHWFTLQTNHGTAWTEGWAEFFDAASHDYYYSIENPSEIEVAPGWVDDPDYEFLDWSQSQVTPGYSRDNTQVEGAVACFFYSLYDGVSLRAPNYTGDNDDLNYSGSFILNNLANRYNILGQLLGTTHIESYKIALKNVLDSQNDASIDALYNSLILQSGNAKPATPTSLVINPSLRNLQWNDNTCPNTVSFYREGQTFTTTFDLVENQEQGFNIYRKAGGGTWDGTLTGYTHVATVGANVTSWTDETYLIGTYSYVVVSYNASGNSIPKAQAVVTYTEGEIRSNVTMSGDITFSNDITVFSGATLTISAGTILRFPSGKKLTSYGNIAVNGTSSSRVTFTSVSGSTAGSWGSLILDGSGSINSNINYANIFYGTGVQFLNGSNATIQNSSIEYNTYGIYFYNSAPSILYNYIRYNSQHAINGATSGSSPRIYHNTITRTGTKNYAGILFTGTHGNIIHNDVNGFDVGMFFNGGSNPWFKIHNGTTPNPNNRIMNCNTGVEVSWGSNPVLGNSEVIPTWGRSSIYDNSWWSIYARDYSTVIADLNWFGCGSPSLLADGTSSIYYEVLLTSDPWGSTCGQQQTIVSGNSSKTDELKLSKTEALKPMNELRKGIKYIEEGNYSAAYQHFASMYASGKQPENALSLIASLDGLTTELSVSEFFTARKNITSIYQPLIISSLAKLHHRRGNKSNAKELFNEIIQRFPKSQEARDAMLRKYYMALHEEKSKVEAQTLLNSLISTYSGWDIDFAQQLFRDMNFDNEKQIYAQDKISQPEQKETSHKDFVTVENYPNPFNPTTNISFTLSEAGNVHLAVYDYLGREVIILTNGFSSAGKHEVTFDASNLSSGIYFYKISAGKYTTVKKMLLLK